VAAAVLQPGHFDNLLPWSSREGASMRDKNGRLGALLSKSKTRAAITGWRAAGARCGRLTKA
jgi:hypothetical protein